MPRMKLKRFFLLVLLSVVVINVVIISLQSPENIDRQEIADCWTESHG